MALEAATYISDLNSANPTATDPVSQADDHIRLLKSTVKATFPNVAGAVTPTHTELNYVDGVTSAIQTQLDKMPGVGQTWTDVKATRAINTNYTNSTAKPITVAVSIVGTTPTSTVAISFTVGGVAGIASTSFITSSSPSNTTIAAMVIVPPGVTYQAVVTQGSINTWVELR